MRLSRAARVAAAYKAKVLCSAVFVCGRDLDVQRAPEVSADAYKVLRFFRAKVDRASGSVTASFFGLWRRTAVHSPGLGCTLR